MVNVSPDIDSAIGGFIMGQMFTGQPIQQVKYNFVALRFEIDFDLLSTLKRVIKFAFRKTEPNGTPPNPDEKVELEFSNKYELKVFKVPIKWGDKPVITFPMCFHSL